MVEDPALLMRSPATQLQQLIINPFKLLPPPRSSLILIIDGVDEFEGEQSQDTFVALISRMLKDPAPAVTIQFIVSGLRGRGYERVRGASSCLVLDQDSKTTISIYLSKYTCAFLYIVNKKSIWASINHWGIQLPPILSPDAWERVK